MKKGQFMKTILLVITSSLVFAGSGSSGNGLLSINNSTALSSPDEIKGSGSTGNGLSISDYFESLDVKTKSNPIISLPKTIKIKVDRDFISPINRWTLKTASRELLAKDIDTIWEYDDLKFNKTFNGNLPNAKFLKEKGLLSEDF